MLFKGTTVRGFWLSHWFSRIPQLQQTTVITELLQLMATGDLTPPVEAEYDLVDFKEAVLHAERLSRSGKVILTG